MSKVDKPSHYTQGGIECIDAIRAALTAEEFRGYCKGNAIKYLWRERHKNRDEDILKCEKYLGFMLMEQGRQDFQHEYDGNKEYNDWLEFLKMMP